MFCNRILAAFLALSTGCLISQQSFADDPPPPQITSITIAQAQKRLEFSPYPAAQAYKVWHTPSLDQPFTEDVTGTVSGFGWVAPLDAPRGFYRLQAVPLDPNALLTATVLNRLAYGPTPDDLDRVSSMGPQAYIDEQLAPETIDETLDQSPATGTNGPSWVYVTVTGPELATDNTVLYIYTSGPGDLYIDDITLVAGPTAGAGRNLLTDGDFEGRLTPPWTISPNLSLSATSTTVSHSGLRSLHIVATSAGSGQGSSIWQMVTPKLTTGQPYTLSYWYLPSTNGAGLTVKLHQNGIVSTPDGGVAGLYQQLANGTGGIEDLRSWYVRHAVGAKRQLFEILTQFFDNHFVTQYSKTTSYFDNFYNDNNRKQRLAAGLEFRQLSRWRTALLNPQCTFYDLLKISAESPSMIIYLDTASSRGDGGNVANENYARELMELFTFGVDNGYDQNDITIMSRAWTGWTLRFVDAANIDNPIAPQSITPLPGVTNNFGSISNLAGLWGFHYRADWHSLSNKSIFSGKTVPARFGPPWAGANYSLTFPARIRASGTNGIEEGYKAIAHLANQPFTEEFISVKLCRVFVHDEFAIGYDFRDPLLSPEGQLVKQCMLAWENGNPKGQIRSVLATIFNSDLFRSHGGSMQKVKTPLEFAVSTIRAFRARNNDGSYTADTDGYSFTTPMSRMGSMNLFDRAEPNGYPEVGSGWISAGTLAERARFAETTSMALGDPAKADGISTGNRNLIDPVAVLKLKLPTSSLSNAGAVADYFLGLLLPGEGKANLDDYRTTAIHLLNTADDGVTSSPFSSMFPTTKTYDTRVRALIAFLLSSQRFQEQ